MFGVRWKPPFFHVAPSMVPGKTWKPRRGYEWAAIVETTMRNRPFNFKPHEIDRVKRAVEGVYWLGWDKNAYVNFCEREILEVEKYAERRR